MTQKYLMTLQELYEVAIANLGPIDQGDYDSSMERARKIALERGITNPYLVIDIKFKEGLSSYYGVTETPYPISAEEWAQFVTDAQTMAEYIPSVYVVDGDKYTAPI